MTETAASALIRSSFAWDNHACMPLRPADTAFLPQIERARAAGIAAPALDIAYTHLKAYEARRAAGRI